MTRTELLEHYLKPTDLTVKELIDRNALAQIMQFAEAYRLEQLRIGGVSKRYYHEICGKGTLIKEYEHSVYGTMIMVKPLKQKDIFFAPKKEFTELPFS